MRGSELVLVVVSLGALLAPAAFVPPGRAAPPASGADPVLVAAGDIAACGEPGAEQTAALLDRIEGTVVTLGDHAYRRGTRREFARCYGPTWGRHKGRTRPAPGNHDYGTPGAAAYFAYFGAAAGKPDRGYYSYDLGAWHIVALNSNCHEIGGCDARSKQARWLRRDLAAHPAACTLAYWHHPRFSSGAEHGGSSQVGPFWEILHAAGADVVLAGHEHNYERFAPQDPAGTADPARGIRQFVVGTGGSSHYGFGVPLPTSEVRAADAFGVLRLTLHPTGYEWAFVPVTDAPFADAGTGLCH